MEKQHALYGRLARELYEENRAHRKKPGLTSAENVTGPVERLRAKNGLYNGRRNAAKVLVRPQVRPAGNARTGRELLLVPAKKPGHFPELHARRRGHPKEPRKRSSRRAELPRSQRPMCARVKREQLGLFSRLDQHLPVHLVHARIPDKRGAESGERFRDHRRLDRVHVQAEHALEAVGVEADDRRAARLLPGLLQGHPLHRAAVVRGDRHHVHQAVPQGQDQGADLRAREQSEHAVRARAQGHFAHGDGRRARWLQPASVAQDDVPQPANKMTGFL